MGGANISLLNLINSFNSHFIFVHESSHEPNTCMWITMIQMQLFADVLQNRKINKRLQHRCFSVNIVQNPLYFMTLSVAASKDTVNALFWYLSNKLLYTTTLSKSACLFQIYTCALSMDVSKIKFRLVFGEFQLLQHYWILIFLGLGAKECVVSYYFNVERNYDALKSKGSCFFWTNKYTFWIKTKQNRKLKIPHTL